MTLVGHTLGEFEILEALGQGGMGAVYKARQLSLKRLVALKTLQPNVADNADYIARFQQEAIAAASLSHPNLVQVYSAGESEGLHWFSMEYVEGESARARLKRDGRIEPREAITIAICVATALQYGWRKAALIHRDIKPDNIFLARSGEVKLGDLGLAKSAAENKGLTSTGHSLGTPYYISPEQARDSKTVDFRADIYSLGCTLFDMVAGRPPFDGSSAAAILLKHLTEPVPSLQDAWPQCPPRLSELVGKMMQKDPADRPQDYAALMGELRHAYAMPAVVRAARADVRHRPEVPPAPVRVAREDVAPEPRDHRRATYVIEADLESSGAGRTGGDDSSVVSAIEADTAPLRAAPLPVQAGPDIQAETPTLLTPPVPPVPPGPPPVAPEAPTMPTPPVRPGSGDRPGPEPVGTGELRLVAPVDFDRKTSASSGPIFIPAALPPRKSADPETPEKSFPLGKIIVALLAVAGAWFYFTHHDTRTLNFDTEDPAEAAPANATLRDWILESHKDGYFLAHREFLDRTVEHDTEVIFQKRTAANSQQTFRNGKIRVRCIIPPAIDPELYVQFYVRMAPDAKGVPRRYEAYFTRDRIVFALNAADGAHEITHWSMPQTPDMPMVVTMEIEAHKNTFTVLFNGQLIGIVKDDTIPGPGTFGVAGPEGTILKNLIYTNLDPPARAAQLPAVK
jgi:serine/threonine protein kinase